MNYYFDISTAARWSGHPVGIVRVERELARRALAHLGDAAAFCVYDLAANQFRIVDPAIASRLIDGRLTIDFSHVASPLMPNRSTVWQLRNALIRVPLAYLLVQRLRGKRFTLAEIAAVRRHEAGLDARQEKRDEIIPLAEATIGPVPLSPDCCIISGGLDWEFKNTRAIYRAKKTTGFRYIAVIYDLIPLNQPQYVIPHYVNLLTEYFGELAWTADAGLCISATSERDFRRYCDEFRIPMQSAHFALGAEVEPTPGEPETLPFGLKDKAFALYVSTIEPRKNHRVLYDAWCEAMERGELDPARHRLVFVGREGWEIASLLSEMRRNPLSRDTILIMSNISDGLLKQLYAEAAFTVFPSHYEGFGLPLAEALAHGKACLTSGAGALREIGEGLRIDIPPRDTMGWKAEIVRLFSDPAALETLEQKIEREFRPTSWDQSATEFFGHVRRLMGEGARQ